MKSEAELNYWKNQYTKKQFTNCWYEYYYTENFNIAKKDYFNKKILDIGCGPLGSLEWVSENANCFGLDPLANDYCKNFDCKNHRMTYIKSNSENIPFPDEYFDYVTSINSLDHVDNVENTLSEIHRVLLPKGLLLIIVEINHPPTICEPHELNETLIEQIKGFNVLQCDFYGRLENLLLSVKNKTPVSGKPKLLSAKLEKT